MKWRIVSLTAFLFVLAKILSMASNIWLSKWTSGLSLTNDTAEHQYQSLGIYTGFGISFGNNICDVTYCDATLIINNHLCFPPSAIASFCGAFSLAIGTWHASYKLQSDALRNVLQCTMQYFDSTPAGRVINRYKQP